MGTGHGKGSIEDPQLLTTFTHPHTKTVTGVHLMNSTEKFKTLGACQDGEDLTAARFF